MLLIAEWILPVLELEAPHRAVEISEAPDAPRLGPDALRPGLLLELADVYALRHPAFDVLRKAAPVPCLDTHFRHF